MTHFNDLNVFEPKEELLKYQYQEEIRGARSYIKASRKDQSDSEVTERKSGPVT